MSNSQHGMKTGKIGQLANAGKIIQLSATPFLFVGYENITVTKIADYF